MVERDSVFALEAERYALTQNALGPAAGEIFLQHERRAAAREPAPAQLAVRSPLMLDGEAEVVDVEAHRAVHVGDAEKWYNLQKVGFDLDVCCHLVLRSVESPNLTDTDPCNSVAKFLQCPVVAGVSTQSGTLPSGSWDSTAKLRTTR